MKKTFVSAAIILMLAGFIARLFGFAYRIFLSNLIGAEGMGLFQLVAPIYTAIILTATAGISIAVSRMVAAQKARNNTANIGRITICALIIELAAGMLVSLLIYLNIERISTVLLGDARTYLALLVIIPCIPPVVAAAALKGYFYGIQQVMPTALSQIAEQAVKIGFVLLLAIRISEKGIEYACAVAALSAALGEIANLAVLTAVYIYKRKHPSKVLNRGKLIRKRSIITELLKAAVPISANRLVISILSAAEYILIPAMLTAGGLEHKSSMEVFGRLTGMALPLILFPSLVTNSLSTTLVPAISESVSLKNYKAVNYRISKSVQVTFVLGMIFTAVFISYPDEIGSLIYKREKIGSLLYMLSFSCVFIYLQQTLTGVLNGLGKQGILLRNTVLGSAVRIIAVCFLIPIFGIQSYVWGLTASFMLNSILDLLAINKITGLVFNLREWVLKPGLTAVVMIFIGRYLYYFAGIFKFGDRLTILAALSLYVLIACFFMMITGVFKPAEIMNLVGVKKIRNVKNR